MAWRSSAGGLRRLLRPRHQRLPCFTPSSPYSSAVDVDHEKLRHSKKSSKLANKSVPVEDTSVPVRPLPDTADPDTVLLKSLKKELKEASNVIKKYQIAIKGSFDPFLLVPNVGTSNLTLRRQIGDEEILVKCILEVEEPEDVEYLLEDNEDELKIAQKLNMSVRISKGSSEESPRVTFLCSYMSHSIVIEDIAYLSQPLEDDYPYSGPFFTDLSPTVQEAFQNVIKARGIDSSLADLIMDHLSSKYQAEYILWLQKIRSFLKR